MLLDAPTSFLAKIAARSAATWHALGAQSFPGELSLATGNSVYRFKNGVFLSRAKKAARSFECPKAMRAMRLIGFLKDENGMWSLSPRWREGAHAVLWKPGSTDAASFILTSAVASFTIEEPDPKPLRPEPSPSPWTSRKAPTQSGVMIRHTARPPSFRRPLPPSMTRIHLAPALPEISVTAVPCAASAGGASF